MARTRKEIADRLQRLDRVATFARAELVQRGLTGAQIDDLLEADPRQDRPATATISR